MSKLSDWFILLRNTHRHDVRNAIAKSLRASTRVAYESILMWCMGVRFVLTMMLCGMSLSEAKASLQQHIGFAEVRYEYFKREGRQSNDL